MHRKRGTVSRLHYFNIKISILKCPHKNKYICERMFHIKTKKGVALSKEANWSRAENINSVNNCLPSTNHVRALCWALNREDGKVKLCLPSKRFYCMPNFLKSP